MGHPSSGKSIGHHSSSQEIGHPSLLVNKYLDKASPGLLVKALHVPPLTLLNGGVHKDLEEGKAHLLDAPPHWNIKFFYVHF